MLSRQETSSGLYIGEFGGILREPAQMAYRDIAVLVDTRGKYRSAVFLEKALHVRSAAEEGHADGGLAGGLVGGLVNDHAASHPILFVLLNTRIITWSKIICTSSEICISLMATCIE